VFVGTPQSTFTGFIPRLRGYMDAPDKNMYFHTEHNDKPKTYKPWDTTPNFMHESSTMWEDARRRRLLVVEPKFHLPALVAV